MMTPRKLVLSIAGTVMFALGAFGSDAEGWLSSEPDYLLKPGTVGSPRTDVRWLRVCRPEMADKGKEAICQIVALVQRSFDATNRMHHTEYIAEVTLADSDRPVMKEEVVVIHSDRWNDLFGDDVNPFKPGYRVVIEVRGDPTNLASLEFTILEISPNQPDSDNAVGRPPHPGNQFACARIARRS